MPKDPSTEPAVAEAAEGPRDFTAFLRNLRDGSFVHEASDELYALIQQLATHASTHTRAKGKLVLTLALDIEANGVAKVVADITTKSPKPERGSSHMWVTRGGNLSPENPRQQKLPLREVSAKAARDLDALTTPETRAL